MSQERSPYNNVFRQRNRGSNIDIHEILKREILNQGPSSDAGYQYTPQPVQLPSSSQQAPPPPLPPQAPPKDIIGIEDTYLLFDSVAKDSTSDIHNGEVRFAIPSLNNSQALENCIQISLSSFYFPMKKNDTGQPEYYFFRRVYMQLATIPSTQSIKGQSGIQYHFEFDIETLGSAAVKLIPVVDTFYFRQPINTITDFVIRFMVPNGIDANFRRIDLPRDILRVRPVPGSNPARFNILNGETVVNLREPAPTVYPYILSPTEQVTVFIGGFASGNTTLNNATNTQTGLVVTTLVTATSFEIASLDYSTLGAPTTPDQYDCNVTIGKNCFRIPMRFTTVKNANTNYLQGVHN